MPKVIYISGPYRDKRGEYYVRKNVRNAEMESVWVWKMGGVALCPHKNTAGLGGAEGIPDRVWLDGDLELLKRCDAIYMIPGWEKSEGARLELRFAEDNGVTILETREEVVDYLSSEK